MESDNNTPLNVNKLNKNIASVESPGSSHEMPNLFDKYNIILGLSILALIAGASFWIFVTYML